MQNFFVISILFIGEVTKESSYTFYDGLLTFSKYELTKEYYFNNEDNRIRR